MMISDYYFAYGSNLSLRQMCERGCEILEMKPGFIKDFKLVFNKETNGKRWPKGSGLASVEYQKGSIVEGIIYRLGQTSINELDKYEGYPNHYDRLLVKAEVKDNSKPVYALLYVANPNKVKSGLTPAPEYVKTLLEGREYLSPEYQLFLEGFL